MLIVKYLHGFIIISRYYKHRARIINIQFVSLALLAKICPFGISFSSQKFAALARVCPRFTSTASNFTVAIERPTQIYRFSLENTMKYAFRLLTVPNMLVGNLALSDAILALFVLPFSAVYAISGEWLFSETACVIFVSGRRGKAMSAQIDKSCHVALRLCA